MKALTENRGYNMNEFDFTLKEIRNNVDDEEIGFHLPGDKAKPVHFATGFFRCITGERSNTDLLSRLVYVTDAKGRTKPGCEISEIMNELHSHGIISESITNVEVQSLRLMMQHLLNADSAVFGEKGDLVSYSAASEKFVTARARYEEVGEIGAGIIKTACPELTDYVKDLLSNSDDEISLLFNPIECDKEIVENLHSLPKWIDNPPNPDAWNKYVESVRQSGLCLLENIKNQPKLLAIRTVIHFSIFHLIRYLAKQESFHDPNAPKVIPFLSVYASSRHFSLIDSSKRSFSQIGQSMARFYAAMYSRKFDFYEMSLHDLINTEKAPKYEKNMKPSKSSEKKTAQNDEVWKTAKNVAKEEPDAATALLRLGQSIHDMVATASDTNPDKYIRGLGVRTGILYPMTSRVKPYFRFSQDVTNMLVMATVPRGKNLPGDEFLSRIRNYFDVVTGALESDFDFCSDHLQAMYSDEDELSKNGESFIEQICDMGHGKVLADGIFRVAIGE